jgi:molecular chaperone DnaJ
LRQTLKVSLAEAVEGARRDVRVARPMPCEKCEGRGAPKDAVWMTCDDCKGEGGTTQEQGQFRIARSCPTCQGRKGAWAPICATCDGTTSVERGETLTVQIPPGIDTGQTLRIPGKGGALAGDLPPGNLFVSIEVEPDARFERHGDDLHTHVTIDSALARDGGSYELALPGGTRRITIKPRTNPGDSLILRGHGAVKLGSPATPIPTSDEPYRSVDGTTHRGNVIVTFDVGDAARPAKRTRKWLAAAGAAALAATATLLYVLFRS